ncbi:hypothetical protein M2X58_27930, partial [Klebsiella pneumoniae]|nr:hypothetical protein [Klebsiella pneumoniae]
LHRLARSVDLTTIYHNIRYQHHLRGPQGVSGGFSGGLLPVLPVSRQKRPEGLSGGADNGCYGKSW